MEQRKRARYSAATSAINASIQTAVALLSVGAVQSSVSSVTIYITASGFDAFNSVTDSSGEFMVALI